MRSRSHRLPVSEPRHDDWVDGSWTVDCICGVTFDDGEEMVDCDECGVWVHTRCVGYVKSEKSFACDKCRSKNSFSGGGGGVRNDSEETEVAEFLVELPTKTLTMDNPNLASASARRPFRLWTDIPMEERVHIQGVPGGETGLFSGIKMSAVFGPELWKCAGYVAKDFNFRYDEFAYLDPSKVEERKEETGYSNGQENSNGADNGAGVLFSFLKVNENKLSSPTMHSVGAVGGGGFHKVVSPTKEKSDGPNLDTECPVDGVMKDSSSVRIVLHAGKRKKEAKHGVSKDHHVKKKVRTVEKEGGLNKRATHDSEAASTFSSDAKHLNFSQDRGSKAARDDTESGKDFPGDRLSDSLGECATNLASNEHSAEAAVRNDVSSEGISRQRSMRNHVPMGSESSSKTNNGLEALKEIHGSHFQSMSVKEEVPGDTLRSCGDTGAGTVSVGIGSPDKEPVPVDIKISGPDAKENQDGKDSDIDEASSHPPNKKLNAELNADDHGHKEGQSIPLDNVKLDNIKVTTQCPHSVDVLPESKVIEACAINSEASDRKVIDATKGLTSGCSRIDKCDESLCNPYQCKREPTGSEGSLEPRKRASGLKHEVADESLKSSSTTKSYSSASYRRKAVVPVAKSTSTSGGIMPKSSDSHMVTSSQNLSTLSKQKELSENSMGTMKNNAFDETVEHERKSSRPKKLVKESSRLNTQSKVSISSKLPHVSDSKKQPSDSKDSGSHSSKVTLVPNVACNNISGESTSPQIDGVPNVQTVCGIPAKVEKHHQSNNTSSRGNVASVISPAASSVPATLSDEELALLLHQELNSSPRVPRISRMRNAGSLPQLACSTATSMLMKRTSSGGTKDQSLSSRRRNKDFSGDVSHGSPDNESKKMERKSSLPDRRRQDSGCSVDPLSRMETDGAHSKSVQSMKKTGGSLSSSDINGQNASLTRPSRTSDDDAQIGGRQINRTLPDLIAEIMSKGTRMTYEELCSAVQPHWPHLRKHNGERYAYSSHFQAVLDCLRNRSEWARLVDRGPKTSTSRKRRKLDTDSLSIESQDEENLVKNSKDVGSKSFESQQEDFPKGKRKTRKRRRLALQGRRVVRRRRRAEVISDDESESFSNSSEESISSEEEIQGGGGTSMVGSEASASSDEV